MRDTQSLPVDPAGFDREWRLDELLSPSECAQIEQAMRALLGETGRLVSDGSKPTATGVAVLGDALEPLGYLAADAEQGRVDAAALLVNRLLRSHKRYRMAAELHITTIQADYEALQVKHVELQASEARYRDLSEQLELRVQEQVKSLDRARRQLYQADKLAAVGQLAAGVAHEINNPIGFIRSNLTSAGGYLERLRTIAGSAGIGARADVEFLFTDFGDLLAECVDGADRVARIVSNLKDFSRVDHAEEELADLNAVIQTVCAVAEPRFAGRIEFVHDLTPLPPYRCQAGHFSQVFLNMVLNASEGIAGSGQIGFASRCKDGAIWVDVWDTGSGIPEDVRPKIFDAFFTTKDVGAGTGLGLTVAHDVVTGHGGRIEVVSEPGKGARFSICLPLAR